MASLNWWTTDYGMTLRANTYRTDIADARSLKLKFKKTRSTETAELTASAVAGDTENYAIEATVPEGWLSDKIGYWIGQAEATFSAGGGSHVAVFSGGIFTIKIKEPPTVST